MQFNDRRPTLDVTDEDYETPITRSSLAQANARLKQATIASLQDRKSGEIGKSTQQRYRTRKSGSELDYKNIGEYLQVMHRD
jgi:hypothetical protein